jgi:hypothetical protein
MSGRFKQMDFPISGDGKWVLQHHLSEGNAGEHWDLRFSVTDERECDKVAFGEKSYNSKRDFTVTDEPKGEEQATECLVSWVLKKGMPEEGKRRLLIRTENHPITYIDFSGEIAGEYGKGDVEIEDTGEYTVVEDDGDKVSIELMGNGDNDGLYSVYEDDEGDMYIAKLKVQEV